MSEFKVFVMLPVTKSEEMSVVACFICEGIGQRLSRQRDDYGKRIKVMQSCKSCNGRGIIQKSKRKNDDGTFRPKLKNSYPSFVATGPKPFGEGIENYFTAEYDEELCYLVGEWKIFQKINRHRYSTDDMMTSFVSVRESRRLSQNTPVCLDMGCGIGSVLLSNAWQLTSSLCFGVEAQKSRFDLAQRSVRFNLGSYPLEQQRVAVINADLRNIAELVDLCERNSFDLITGTPPYFNPKTQMHQPNCLESLGCLFEMRGNIFDYCLSAASLLRPRKLFEQHSTSDLDVVDIPSIFVVCNSSLQSAATYNACLEANMVILRRIDVVPREGKPTLFSVFVMTLSDWINHRVIKEIYPGILSEVLHNLTTHDFKERLKRDCAAIDSGRVNGSVYGEAVESVCVRLSSGQHSEEYAEILNKLSKPSSYDRELFNPHMQMYST